MRGGGPPRGCSQFTHCIDVGPTVLELAGLPQPTHVGGIAQTPMHGTSFLPTFADPEAEEQHTQQYFEIYGYRAMYKGRLVAVPADRADALGRDPRHGQEVRAGGVAP
jgi:arylsulfatase A-like enzyme